MNEIMYKRPTHEEYLVVKFARRELTYEDMDDISNTIEMGIDWEVFYKLCLRQSILPLIKYHFNTFRNLKNTNFPKYILLNSLVSNHQSESFYKISTNELLRLNNIFENNKIKFVVVKGPSIVKLVYKDPKIRPYGDMDLLLDSNDIIKAHHLLIENGYIFAEETNYTDKEINERANVQSHLLEYVNKSNNCFVEMHHFYRYQYFNEIYNNAKLIDGFYMPDLIDQFIYSCHHVWDHYVHIEIYENLLRKDNLILKNIMDVRELYLEIALNKKIDDLYKRVVELNVSELVFNIINLAERIYGKFAGNINNLYDGYIYNLDWNSKYFVSYIEDRLFKPQNEYARLQEIYMKAKQNNITGYELQSKKININKEKSYTNTSFWDGITKYNFNTSKPDNKLFWGNIVYNQTCFIKESINTTFSMVWDNNYLYFKISINEDNGLFTCYKELQNNAIVLGLGKKENDSSKGYILKKKGGFCNKILYKQSNSKILNEIENSCVCLNIHKEQFELIAAFPWEHINFNPESDKSFYLYICLEVYKNYDEMIMIWPSGRGFTDYNCSNLAKVNLLL
jgi:hypothetical protein